MAPDCHALLAGDCLGSALDLPSYSLNLLGSRLKLWVVQPTFTFHKEGKKLAAVTGADPTQIKKLLEEHQ